MKTFIKENWFKIIAIILVVWFLTIFSKTTFNVCIKEASGLPPIVSQRCW